MLDGKELEGKFDGGGYSVDVDDKGGIKIELAYSKDFGFATANSSNSVETNIFKIAEKIAAQTSATWDDNAVAALKKMLGIA